MSLIKKGGITKGIGATPRQDDTPQEQEPDQPAHPPRDADGTRRPGDPLGTKLPAADPSGTKRPGHELGASMPEDPHGTTANPRPPDQKTDSAGNEYPVLKPGTVLQGRYHIEGVLGVGGMSVVYRGRDMRFRDVVRACAIKEMFQTAPDSQTRLLSFKQFEREAGLLATFNHPAIPKVYDFFEENGRVYLAMELIDGQDLEDVLEQSSTPLNEGRVGAWAVQICDVLSYLHNQDTPIVFRDMKPSNIVLMADERIVLIDFGIARLLDRGQKGTMIGTEGYAPPELYRGVAEPQGDIYALGATMHHLLTGSDPRTQTPFTFQERLPRTLNPMVTAEMQAVLMQALAYKLDERWESAEQFKQALLRVPSVASVAPASSNAASSASAPPLPVHAQSSITEVVWRFTCEDEVRSSPCINNGMLFVGCYDTNLYAIDSERGEFRWKYATEGGIASSPSVWQDIVIVGSEDGGVYGVDARMGRVRWVFRTGKPVRSSPRLDDRAVYIGSDDQHFYALDGMRGTQIWNFRTWMPIRSSAGIGDGVVYMGGDDSHVYCLDSRAGKLRWKQRTQQPVRSTPLEHENLVLVGSTDNNLYALDAQGGWPVWRFRTKLAVNSSPSVHGTRVLVGSSDGCMYAVERKNGRQAWKFDTESQITSSPRISNGRVYFGSINGTLYCLDVESGELVWSYATGGPLVGTPWVTNEVVYIGSLDHNVYALKA